MSGDTYGIGLAVVAAALAGVAAGWWLSRRGYLRGVRELEAYLRGWEDAEHAEHAAGAATVAGRAAPAAPFRPAPLRPVYAQLEARRQAFLELRTLSTMTARRFQTLMDVLREGVLLYDVDGRLLFVNGPVRELGGATELLAQDGADETVLRRVGEVLEAESDIPAFVREVLQADVDPAGREVRVRAGGQERRFFATPHLIRSRQDPARQGLLLLLTDVAVLEAVRGGARCEVTLDHVRLAAELMAHRVRNPLNSIVLVLELIRRGLAVQPEQEKNLATIRSEVARLEGRLQRFLDMVRRRGHRTETVELVSVIESVCELLYGPARDARVTIRQQLQVPSARLRADEVELLRAVLGPCAEAIRESSPGAELKVRLDSNGREHLLLLECAGVSPGSIALTVAEELVTGSGGTLAYDDPQHPTRLTYRFRADPGAETSAT